MPTEESYVVVDPITELVHALSTDGRPTDQWLSQWSNAADPVAAAWNVSQAALSMIDLLRFFGEERAMAAKRAYREAYLSKLNKADGIRSVEPTPPTLDALIEAIANARRTS
jgi:hypothetical protein